MVQLDKYKPLLLEGPFKDLGNVLKVARKEGQRVFRVNRVIVRPCVTPDPFNPNNVTVYVKPLDGEKEH